MFIFYLSLIDDPEMQSLFIKLFNEYDDKLKSIAFAITNHVYYSDEALSKTWESIAMNIDIIAKFTDLGREAYLKKVTRNNALDYAKQKDIDKNMLEYNDNYFYDINQDDIETIICDSDKNDEYLQIINCMSKLAYIYREILTYRYIHNLSVSKISKLLNIEINTVRSRLQRAKREIRIIMKGQNK